MRRGWILLFVALVFVPRPAWPQGMPLGPEFRANTYTANHQFRPSVAADSSGNFVVVWKSDTQDGSGYGVYAQRYASSGAPLGPEFRVNTFTTAAQQHSAVAADSSGNFVVLWDGFDPSVSQIEVFGQRYASSGAPLGAEFRVNTHTSSFQDSPSVAADASGNFVVVWHGLDQDGSGYGVFGQRYSEIVPVELLRFGVK